MYPILACSTRQFACCGTFIVPHTGPEEESDEDRRKA
jgi:hypothetical protein